MEGRVTGGMKTQTSYSTVVSAQVLVGVRECVCACVWDWGAHKVGGCCLLYCIFGLLGKMGLLLMEQPNSVCCAELSCFIYCHICKNRRRKKLLQKMK